MCEYCEKPFKDMRQDVGTDSFRLADWNGYWQIETYADHSGRINYCPMCARDLRGNNEKENI